MGQQFFHFTLYPFPSNMELIPAIDIIGGQCVRLTKGDYDQKKVYSNDPVEVARNFERMGFRRLHVVDLDGAKSKHIVNTATLRAITEATSLVVDFGGGIKSDDDLQQAFRNGAAMVTIGSVAVTHPELMDRWIATYGPERIILGADARNGRLSINGWLEDSDEDVVSFIGHYYKKGIRNVLCTDIAKDGTLTGPSIALYRQIMAAYPHLHLIASGGVSCNDDIHALQAAGIPAVVFGKAFYEGRLDLSALSLSAGQGRGIAKRIIPCLDVKDGRTVKGTCFVNLREAGDPVELAKAYSEAGADELVFLDITASHEGRKTFTEVVKRVAAEINIPFTVGGGINELDDVSRLLDAGADKVSVNSAALRRPQLITEITTRYGSQVCVCAIDARIPDNDGLQGTLDEACYCYTNGGRVRTERTLLEWAREAQDRGAGEILYTSMNHDGTKQGFANTQLAQLHEQLSIPVIASGGAGQMSHFRDAFTLGHADAALAASVFHFGEIPIPQLKQYLQSEGINVRI